MILACTAVDLAHSSAHQEPKERCRHGLEDGHSFALGPVLVYHFCWNVHAVHAQSLHAFLYSRAKASRKIHMTA